MTEKKMEATRGTQLTRFNALRHGILSRLSLLPWEDPRQLADRMAALSRELGQSKA